MNNFEQTFFKKYIPENEEIINIYHSHPIKIIDDIILALVLGVFIPVFLYYNSWLIQENIPFYYLEWYLIILYFIIIYKIFDWYNDVLILTKSNLIKLDWSLFKTNTISINYEHIEWVWVNKNWIIDTLLQKWDLIIHKFWEEEIIIDEIFKPFKVASQIEEIISNVEHPEQLDKFEIMLNTLSRIVEDYIETKKITKQDIFEKDINNYQEQLKNDFLNTSNYSKKEKLEFLEKIKKQDGTIDLR